MTIKAEIAEAAEIAETAEIAENADSFDRECSKKLSGVQRQVGKKLLWYVFSGN